MTAVATDVALPPLNADLWAHQKDAFTLARDLPGFLIAADMGCGKSATAIALLEHDQAQRVLILCPKNVVGVWPAQLNGPLDPPGPPEGFSPRQWDTWSGRVQGARGPKRTPSVSERAVALIEANTAAIKFDRPFAAVVNYEAAHLGDMKQLLLGTEWDALICDESHRLKKPSGKASRLADSIAYRVRKRGGRVLCLTGTPMPHSPLDVWAQLRVIDGGRRLFPTYHRFIQRYGEGESIFVAGGKQRTVYKDLRADRLEEFTGLVGEVMHSVSADDVLDLPGETDRYVTTELSHGARTAYQDLERHGIAEAKGGTLTAANAMVLVLRLAQATSGFGKDVDTDQVIPLDPDQMADKAAALGEVLDDLPQREPIVVFCRFHADLDAVKEVCELSGRRYGELSGRRRDGLTEQSRMSSDIDVLGAQLQSGGVGIDLSRARIGIYYSLDFNLGNHLQSRARLARPGQTRPVVFFHLLAKDTVDGAIFGALKKRQAVIDQVIETLKTGGTP